MSDLDDEELEATRRINGVAKESDIEKDRFKNLIKAYEEVKTQSFIIESINKDFFLEFANCLIAKIQELEIKQKEMCEEYCPKTEKIKKLEAKLEFKNWGDLDNTQFEEYMNQFIPKQKVKDEIDRHKIAKEGFEKEYDNKHYEDDGIRARDFYGIVTQDRIIQVLEELLEEK